MSYTVLTEYGQVARYTEQVSKLADENKQAFGFLAASVYEQMALKEQLWIVSDDIGKLKGYLMFGGTMPRVKIFQLYVRPNARGDGIGRILIEALIDHSNVRNFHTISARVASDLPANKFWEHMGFVISRQDKGGETKNRKINIRAYPLIDNDLFGKVDENNFSLTPSGPILSRDSYCL